MGKSQVKLTCVVNTVNLRDRATSVYATEAAPLQRCSYIGSSLSFLHCKDYLMFRTAFAMQDRSKMSLRRADMRHASLAESKVMTNQCWYKGRLSKLT